MRIRVDRDLPVPVPTQIQGQIEFGMSIGDFPPGSRLPSVRELASELAVSPVTVSGVYRGLRERGLIESVPGSGTFVRRRTAPGPPAGGALDPLDVDVARLLGRADRLGMARAELLARVQAAAWAPVPDEAPLRIALVGAFEDATRRYAGALRPYLRPGDRLEATTFSALDAGADDPLAGTDVALTFVHREHELAARLGPDVPVAALHLIPSTRTRVALAELDPRAHVCLVSRIPEFLPTLRRSFERFASHVASVDAVVPDGDGAVTPRCEDADVVIFATGSASALDGLPSYVRRFEFLHEPDPVHVEATLVPTLARLRRAGGSGRPTPPRGTKGTP